MAEEACMVLSSYFALFVQALLGGVSVATLLFKWRLECRADRREGRQPRQLLVFTLDGTKQLCGAAWLHITNLFFATLLHKVVGTGDQCEWYWINIVIDTTLGCVVAWGLLQFVNMLIVTCLGEDNAEDWVDSGHYRDPEGKFKVQKMVKQTLLWVVVVMSSMKACMGCS
jgi:hypothetical protein